MYLYLYQDESVGARPRTKRNGEYRSDFSDRMVKSALRDYAARQKLAITEEELKTRTILRGEKGKPYFAFSDAEGSGQTEKRPIHYSVSHSGNWWGCLMSEEPVGFDLEQYHDKTDHIKIAKRYFTEAEYQYALQEGLDGFFEIWVRKEAYVKFLGLGLSKGLDSFSVIKDGKLSPVVIGVRNEDGQSPPCRIEGCLIQNGVKAAYCSSSGKQIKSVIPIGIV